jgi:hypothetical protein
LKGTALISEHDYIPPITNSLGMANLNSHSIHEVDDKRLKRRTACEGLQNPGKGFGRHTADLGVERPDFHYLARLNEVDLLTTDIAGPAGGQSHCLRIFDHDLLIIRSHHEWLEWISSQPLTHRALEFG